MKFTRSVNTTVKAFGLALCLSTSLCVLPTVFPSTAQAQTAEFFSSGFNFCDAKLIALVFNQSTDQAKAWAAQKIRNGNVDVVKAELRRSRRTYKCTWEDLPYQYNDAERLARYWGVSPYEAKLKAADMYTKGQPGAVNNALAAAG